MKKATFEQGYELAKGLFSAEKAAAAATTDEARKHWLSEVRKLGNKITPAFKQAAAPTRSLIANEALRIFRQQDGTFNCTTFIGLCRSSGIAHRQYRSADSVHQFSDSSIRKLVSKLGIEGKKGRPRKT